MNNRPTLSFVIPGKPKGKERHKTRVVQRPGGKSYATFYTPPQTAQYETEIAYYCNNEIVDYERSSKVRWIKRGQYQLAVFAYIEIPKSWPVAKTAMAAQQLIRPTCKPDWDNIGKVVSDGLNGIAWTDDARVVDARTVKRYTTAEPRIEVVIIDITDDGDKWARKKSKLETK